MRRDMFSPVEWGKGHWDDKRYIRFALGSIAVTALIFVGLVWPYKFTQATDPRISTDVLLPLFGFGILLAVALFVFGRNFVNDARPLSPDGSADGRRLRTLVICTGLPVALVAWWAVSLRSDHAAEADMFSAFKDYTQLIKNGDLLGDPSIDSGGAEIATVCADGPGVTLRVANPAVKPVNADKTSFCAAISRDNGQTEVEAGYSRIRGLHLACFYPADPTVRSLLRAQQPYDCTAPESFPEITTRLPYNPSTTVLPSN
jgi:hypothetical protein